MVTNNSKTSAVYNQPRVCIHITTCLAQLCSIVMFTQAVGEKEKRDHEPQGRGTEGRKKREYWGESNIIYHRYMEFFLRRALSLQFKSSFPFPALLPNQLLTLTQSLHLSELHFHNQENWGLNSMTLRVPFSLETRGS